MGSNEPFLIVFLMIKTGWWKPETKLETINNVPAPSKPARIEELMEMELEPRNTVKINALLEREQRNKLANFLRRCKNILHGHMKTWRGHT